MKKIFSIAIIAVCTLMVVSCKNGNKENVENEAVVATDTTVAAPTSTPDTTVVAAPAESEVK